MNNLFLNISDNQLFSEFKYYQNNIGKISSPNNKNYIVKYFQQDVFFKTEKILFQNKDIRDKLINNRMKYLNKNYDQLTVEDILYGFKRSGLYYGYSHFNPLTFKWFINNYNCKICFDPCGGWGHRLLGSNNLDLYIYNDLSTSIYNNVNNIIDFFNIRNVKTYNKDAYDFIPEENYDSMFTCPPYYNLEHYECGDFETYDDFLLLIDCLFYAFYYKESCKYFGLVIREDLLDNDYKSLASEIYLIKNKASKHIVKSINHHNNEYLYVFDKEKIKNGL